MSKHLKWILYNKWRRNKGEKFSKSDQEKWIRYLINYYKKPYKSIDIEERWQRIVAHQRAEKEKDKLMKKVIIAHKEQIKEIRQMDSYGDKNIGSQIIRAKKHDLLNKNLELKIKDNKLLNYFNIKRTKDKMKRKDIKPFKKMRVELKYVLNNIIEGHKEDLESRKISNKLLKPNYYFPSKYIERSLPSQTKHWMSNVYSFLRRDAALIILLDRFTAELIKRFFSVKRIKRRLITHKWRIYTYRLLETGFKYKATKSIYKQLNRIIKFSRRGGYTGDSNITTYFHPGILKSKWLKRQINKSIKIKKKLLRRRINLFGGYEPKKTSRISKWKRLLLGKPVFKHTSFNVIIDLFIFNNKTNQRRKFRNLMLRRFAYKYMYSLYANVYKKVNETLNRPRFFYINIIEPKVFPYYTKVVKSYEEWIFKYNKGLVITICLMLLNMDETVKKTIKSVKKTRKSSFSWINKVFIYKSLNLKNMYINILNKLGIENLFNIDKNKVDVINIYKKEEDSDGKLDKRPYKVREYFSLKSTTLPLNKKQMRKKINRMKFKTRKKQRKKKKDQRIKKFGEKKLTFIQFKKKQIFERRRGKQMDQKEFKEKIKSFHLYSHQQKKNDSSNEKKYSWYSPKEWEKRRKEKMNKNKNGKLNQNNKSLVPHRRNNIRDKKNGGKNALVLNPNKNNRNKNIINNVLNRNIINDKISNNYIKEKKPVNKLLTKFKEVKRDRIRPLSKRRDIENISAGNKDVILETLKDLTINTEDENINSLLVPHQDSKNEYKKLIHRINFKNYYKKYWEYKKAQKKRIIIIDPKLSKNKRKKLKRQQERENLKFTKAEDNYVKNVDMLLLLKKKTKLNNIKLLYNLNSNVETDRKLKDKKEIGSLNSLSYYINKRKWLMKQEIIRKKYALECIKNMNVPVRQKKKRFQKKVKKNKVNSINLVNENKLNKLNKKVKNKNTKKVWDKLEYSLLSLLSKYLSVYGKDKFQSHYVSIDSIYNKAKDMLIFSNIWYTIYSLSFIKNEYSNIVKNILVAKVWDTIPQDGEQGSPSFIEGNYFRGVRRLCYSVWVKSKSRKSRYRVVLRRWRRKFYSGYTDNKREGELKEKLFYYDNIFKSYYRKLIPIYIKEYYKYYLLFRWRNYWMYALRLLIIDKVKGINKSHMILLNFIIVRTLLGLLEYNYRSLIRLKPKYYYLNKLRYYQTKFKRINLNSWANSVKYVKKLRKTPNNFWKRYHRLASFYYGRIIQNAELDTKRKIFVPFVLYFEDVLYTIYGKWAIIRLWPLKKYYLSSYILARRLMALILWRARKIKTVTRFRRKTRFYLSIVRGLEITRGYHDYYKNSISQWPNTLVDMINEKRKEHYLSYKNLEYLIKRKERFYTFNTHLLYRNKLSYSHFSLWYKYIVGKTLYKKFTKRRKKLEEDLIFKSRYINRARWVKTWMKPFRHHLHGLIKGHDISSLKFTLAGRTGTRRNNARKMYKRRFYGHTRIPRYYAPEQWKYYNIGIPTIRGDMKSTYDYSKTISKSISGALSVKVWMTSKISVDIQELLMLLVDIKYLYSQLFNKYFLVGKRFIIQDKKIKRWPKRINWWHKMKIYKNNKLGMKYSLIKEKNIYKKYLILNNNYKKNKYKLNYSYIEMKNSLKSRTTE